MRFSLLSLFGITLVCALLLAINFREVREYDDFGATTNSQGSRRFDWPYTVREEFILFSSQDEMKPISEREYVLRGYRIVANPSVAVRVAINVAIGILIIASTGVTLEYLSSRFGRGKT